MLIAFCQVIYRGINMQAHNYDKEILNLEKYALIHPFKNSL